MDGDCIFVSQCRFNSYSKEYIPTETFFELANKNYVSECQGPVLCEGNCRCDSQKRQRIGPKYDEETGSFLHTTTLQLRCVDSQCIEEEHPCRLLPEPDPPSEEEGGSSGQR